MLTRTGIGALVVATGMFIAGRLLGTFELFLLGTGIAVVVGVSALSVLLARPRPDVVRTLLPTRVHRGAPARAELLITNSGTRTAPVLQLRDFVSGTRGASVLVAPLAPGESAVAAYQLPTDRRGLRTVGPLQLALSDPFELVRRRRTVLGPTSLLVYPPIDEITPPAHRPGLDPQARVRRPRSLGRSGEDFSSLRAYVVGDDPRRVHWPSVARTGELVVRQLEQPHDERTTVVLDVDRAGWWPEGFEAAVSAAASVLHAAARRGDEIALATTAQPETVPGSSAAHLETVLHRLALVEPADATAWRPVADEISRVARGGTLVVVAPASRMTGLGSLAAAVRRFGSVIAVVFDPPSSPGTTETDAGPGATTASPAGVVLAPAVGTVLRCGPGEPFPAVWERLMGPAPAAPRPGPTAAGPTAAGPVAGSAGTGARPEWS
jgi:uncharacterized protein (DUF58 family)